MKKTIYIAVAVFMLLAFSACGDKDSQTSSSPTDISPSDIEILEPTPSPEPQPVSDLSICGIPVVSGGQPTGIGYKGADYKDGVLTLNDISILADYGSNSAIYFTGDLEIVVSGEDSITTQNGTVAIMGDTTEDGVVSNLIISGDGSLTVSSDENYGIACSGAITVTVAVLDITGAENAVEGGADALTLGEGLVLAEDGAHISVGPAD